MGLKARTGLIQAYLSRERDFGVAMTEMLKGVARPPCTRLGPNYVDRIVEADHEYRHAYLRGIDTPLWWPRALPHFDLYKVATECFDPEDWHHYEIPRTQVRPGDVVLDCGAAEGMFTLRVLDRAGHVYAFEPLPMFTASLERTFGPSGKVSVVPLALSDAEGSAYLDGGSLYGMVSDQETGTPIRLTTLDAWCEREGIERVNYIKADLESFELRALKGAAATIRAHRPRIAITVYHPGNDWREIAVFLQGLVPEYRYTVKGISYNGGRARPVMLHLWTE